MLMLYWINDCPQLGCSQRTRSVNNQVGFVGLYWNKTTASLTMLKREREREAAFEYNSEFVRCWDRQRHPSASVCDAPPAAFYARKPLNHVVNIVKPSGLVRFSLAGTKPTWIGSREAHWCYVLVGIEPLVTWVKVLCATPPQLRICHSVMGVSYCHEWVYTAVIESP